MSVVTRFAPSPTGYLHIWSLRTVLYNYLFAKQKDGKFMLRVEDTDRSRYVEGSVENMLEVLASVWLIPDEGPNNPWENGPYFQSERLDLYQKYITELLEKDKAYYCFCSSEKLTQDREEQQALWLPTKYNGTCRYLSEDEISKNLADNIPYTVRLKVPKEEIIEFRDTIKGKISVPSKDVDDQVLLKTDKFPTYHFAVVIDDHLMWITDIIRWDEWIPSTPKHILLYSAFWWELPRFSHVPPLIWKSKKKLSKRDGDVAVELYLEKWYLVEALMNYLALLWWNPKTTEEFFTMEELIQRFDLSQVHKAWAFFDVERLDFFNSHYLKTTSTDTIYDKLITYLNRYDNEFSELIKTYPEEFNKKILEELKWRIKKFDEYKGYTTCFYNESKIPELDLIINPKMKLESISDVLESLKVTLDLLENSNMNITNLDSIKALYIEKIKEAWMKNWQVLWPARCALSWEKFSPWAFEMIYILGKEESLKRIRATIEGLK